MLWSNNEHIRDVRPRRPAAEGAKMTIHIPAEPLTDFCAEIFARVGCQSEEANRVSASLVDSNLTGHDSHGVIRVPRYVDWVRSGDLIPNQSIERVVDTPVIGVVDGHFGFGQIDGADGGRYRR